MSTLAAAISDKYRIERELGAGGMATVHLARDLRHDRDVAIKVLHPDLAAALGAERFLAEIKTTARLQHPHILPLLDSGAADGQLYYVMPFVAGETLRARLEREGELPIDDTIRIAREVGDALGYAHAAGIVHRDIKPENILLQGGHALVADFGIALAVEQSSGQRMTQTGLSLGTPSYMSPEQAMGEKRVDARSDVYALAAMTYEMLTGEPPFTGPNVQAIVSRLLTEEPRPIASQRKAVPEQVDAAIMKGLEKRPADRWATASEFVAAMSGAVAMPARTTSLRAAAPASSMRVTIGLAAALVVASGVAIAGWMRKGAEPEVVRYRVTVDSIPATGDWAGDVAISPDGFTLVRAGGPNGALLVRHRDETSFSVLPGSEGSGAPFFSPDGTRIGFFRNNGFVTIPITGGVAESLVDSVGSYQSASWAPDGNIYIGTLARAEGIVARVRPHSKFKPEQVSFLDSGEVVHLYPDVLPDGKRVLFTVGLRDGKRVIAIGEVGKKAHKVLFDGVRARYARSGHIVYTSPDGRLWAVGFDLANERVTGNPVQVSDRLPNTIMGSIDFAISNTGTLVFSSEDAGRQRRILWVTRNGGREQIDSAWVGEFNAPRLSRDGSRIAVAISSGLQSDIWIRPVSGGTPYKVTSIQGRNNVEPDWSPDGEWVSYIAGSGVAATGDVYRQRVAGGADPELLVRSQRPLSEQMWVNATTLLVRTTTPTVGQGDILRFRIGQDSAPAPFIATPVNDYTPDVSPDGKWVAYVSNESGQLEVYVRPFENPNAGKWRISTNGGSGPRWSHKGDELFYLGATSRMMVASVTTAPAFRVNGTRMLFDARDYVEISPSRHSYDVSRDDQRFLMVGRAEGSKHGGVEVIEHWGDWMRRKAK